MKPKTQVIWKRWLDYETRAIAQTIDMPAQQSVLNHALATSSSDRVNQIAHRLTLNTPEVGPVAALEIIAAIGILMNNKDELNNRTKLE